MTTIRIIKTRSGFANVPATYEIAADTADEGADSSLVSARDYLVPEGYAVAERQGGILGLSPLTGPLSGYVFELRERRGQPVIYNPIWDEWGPALTPA